MLVDQRQSKDLVGSPQVKGGMQVIPVQFCQPWKRYRVWQALAFTVSLGQAWSRLPQQYASVGFCIAKAGQDVEAHCVMLTSKIDYVLSY